MKLTLALLIAFLAACKGDKAATDSGSDDSGSDSVPTGFDTDADGDGFTANIDCNDDDRNTFPGAPEQCDGEDNDCDGAIDEDGYGSATGYQDKDGDGYGDIASPTTECELPEGYVASGDDCNDRDHDIYPDAPEFCDDIDNDCDDDIDEAPTVDGDEWYLDADEDGFGDPTTATNACTAPDGYTEDPTDCDDADRSIYPGAPEQCDGKDNDCDSDIDEDGAAFELVWYADRDEDGFGDAGTSLKACAQPDGYTDNSDDCEDLRPDINPDADELCNGYDDDCDTDIDENDAVDADTWYYDGDGDSYGADAATTVSCDQPTDYAAYGGDCDDGNAAYNPGATEDDCTDPNDYNCDGSTGYDDLDDDGYPACDDCDDDDATISPAGTEICDALDNDCDTVVDEDDAVDAANWYADADVDGYGDPDDSTTACEAPDGFVANGEDCDDTEPTTSPAGPEACDGIDNDCDDEVDEEDAWDATTWYTDADTDGYGTSSGSVEACDAPTGYADNDDDCDDSKSSVNPGASEICDSLDNDCNLVVDDDATDDKTWYRDADNDYFGDPDTTYEACTRPTGYRRTAKDCDDTDAAINPDAEEICDLVDNDCDGTVDGPDATGAVTVYDDGDSDGYGDDSTAEYACEAGTGQVQTGGDCDDADSAYNPGVSEADCDDPNDYNCDGSTGYSDGDGDGFSACTDCNDASADAYPGGTEVCDGLDNDCDGAVDGGSAGDSITWYGDADADGYGLDGTTKESCSKPSGYALLGGDCDDGDDTVSPGASEVCDSKDNDCDSDIDEDATDAVTYYYDADGDRYGGSAVSTKACSRPTDYRRSSSDCDDSNSAIFPGATEICDGVDNDCDSSVDEAGATGGDSWYADDDSDGFGDASTSTAACTAPTGYIADDNDCDDTDASINPDATETCDGVDEDCDGTIDDGAGGGDTWYADADGDDFGDPDSTTVSCAEPSGYTLDSADCDDGDASINPDASERCDGVDNNCDGEIDELGAVDGTDYYADTDGDGYGDPDSVVTACEPTDGATTDSSDCDDTDAGVWPGAIERVNGGDDDCDGVDDETEILLLTGYQCWSLTSSRYADAEIGAVETFLGDMDLAMTEVDEDSSGFDGSVSMTDYKLVLYTKCGQTWKTYNEAGVAAMLSARDAGVATLLFDHDMANRSTTYVTDGDELTLLTTTTTDGSRSTAISFDTASTHAAYLGDYGTPEAFTYSWDVDKTTALGIGEEVLAYAATSYPSWVVYEDETSGARASTILMGIASSSSGTVANTAGLDALEIMFKNSVAWLLRM